MNGFACGETRRNLGLLMTFSAHPRSLISLVVCLLLVACRDNRQEEVVADPVTAPSEVAISTEPSVDQEDQSASQEKISAEQEVAELESKIQARKQTIDDLGSAVLMERAKLDENPDYDQSFLNEVLYEQDQERLEIEKARKRIEILSRSND
ncbi:MAG: hypothetical protein AB8D78_14700 [Akkermansiaceae bacterium]